MQSTTSVESCGDQQKVYVMMGENETGFFGLVCRSRGRAESELRRILTNYKIKQPRGVKPMFLEAQVERFIQRALEERVTVCEGV